MNDSLQAAQPLQPILLKLLAHELRWEILVALVQSDYRVHELVGMLDHPFNLVSYHLKRLRDAHLVHERRSSADGRDVYYSINFDRLVQQYRDIGEALHPALSDAQQIVIEQEESANLQPVRVLFLCTQNSARSQMAEGIMRHLGGNLVRVKSAGTAPSGVHPNAIRVLQALHIDISGQRSKHLNECSNQPFDYVITVCDRVREVCPHYPGDPEQKHWSFADPAAVEEEHQYAAFMETAHELTTRIRFLLHLIAKDQSTKKGESDREQ